MHKVFEKSKPKNRRSLGGMTLNDERANTIDMMRRAERFLSTLDLAQVDLLQKIASKAMVFRGAMVPTRFCDAKEF